MSLPFPALLADIGGTNARFCLLAGPQAPLSAPVRLETARYERFDQAAAAAIAAGGFVRPRSLLVGAAGPVTGRTARLTNAPWLLDGADLLARLGLDQGILFNDFETLALALPALTPEDTLAIGAAPAGEGLRLVIGPGTGLGVGALARAGGHWLPMPSEGGHIGFAAETAEDRALWDAIDWAGARPQAEMLLAGPGLARLWSGLARLRGGAPAVRTPAEVVAAALGGEDELALRCVRIWLRLIARFAGDMALTFMASGGVTLAGGILPRLAGLIDADAFRAAFAHNAVHAQWLDRLPVHLVTAAEPALLGLAALAREPQSYLIDYRQRLWR